MKYEIPSPMSCKDALKKLYPDSSRRTLQNWLLKGRFTLNGKPLKREDTLLPEGSILASLETFKKSKVGAFEILYEDTFLLAIDKPKGLLSVPLDEKKQTQNALKILRMGYKSNEIYPVHRIDRETSGVLLFAKGKKMQDQMKSLFEVHDIERKYLAILEGQLREEKGTWEHLLQELPSYDVVVSEEGKRAVTHFQVLHRSAKYTFLELSLETGKKHQIRVQAQMAGAPVLGDKRYGSTENPIKRLCLHAFFLSFIHPMTQKKVRILSSLPPSFKKLGGNIEALHPELKDCP